MTFDAFLKQSQGQFNSEAEAREAYIKKYGEQSTEPVSESSEVTSPTSPQELTQEQWLAMGKEKGWGVTPQGTTLANSNTIIEKSTTPETSPTNPMIMRVRGIANNAKTKYSQFEDLVNQYGADGEISRKDRKAIRNQLGLSRSQMRGIAKGLNGGDASALNNYTKGLEKRSYVQDGKLFTEGQEGWTEDAFNNAKYKGTDVGALTNQYNEDVMNWRKNATITYNPDTNTYMASGFNGGADIDITNSDWFKNDTDRQRKAQLAAYRGKVDAMDSVGLAQNYGDAWGTAGLATTLGLNQKDLDLFNGKIKGQTMSDEDKAAFKEKAAVALRQKLDGMRKNSEGGFDFNGSIQADQITKYLIEQQKNNPNAYSFLDAVSFAPSGRYASAGRTTNTGGPFNLLKQGGSLKEKAKAFKKGGAIQYAGWGDALYGAIDFIPVVGTFKQGYEMATSDKPTSGSDWASLGLSALGDALMVTGIGAGAGAALKGASTVTKAGIKGIAAANKLNRANKTLKAANAGAKTASKELAAAERVWLNAPHGVQKAAALTTKNEKAAALVARNAEKATAQASINTLERAKQLQAAARTRGFKEIGQGLKPTLKLKWRNPFTAGWKKTALGAVVGQTGRNMGSAERAAWEEYKQQAGLMDEQPIEYTTPNVIPGSTSSQPISTYTPDITYSPYFSDQILVGGHKNGGILNMNKINYFQEGGAMAPKTAPAAAPAKGGQDIQAQVMQLVQAAMSGDEQANQAIQQIMQAAQQGDQQAAQIAQMIQEVAKQIQGQAPAAKNGAKLAYIKSLKSGCPAGTEAKYYKKGGTLCKECVSKSRNTEMYQDKGLFKATNSTSNAVKSAYNNIVNRVNNTIFGEQQTQVETSGIDITGLYKKGGCLKKKLCGKKKAQEGTKVTEEKCGGKAKKKYFGGSVESDKCGGKTKKAACGSKAPKAACGTKANMDKCGGKAKKKYLTGGILTLEALQAAYKSLNA